MSESIHCANCGKEETAAVKLLKWHKKQWILLCVFRDQCRLAGRPARPSVARRYLKRVNWDVNRAIENWKANNRCPLCYEWYEDSKGTCIIKDKFCNNNQCAGICCRDCSKKSSESSINKCPFCNVGSQLYKGGEERGRD